MTAVRSEIIRIWPQPSGWRARCTYTPGCDFVARGWTRDDVLSQFLDHAETEHSVIEPEDGAP